MVVVVVAVAEEEEAVVLGLVDVVIVDDLCVTKNVFPHVFLVVLTNVSSALMVILVMKRLRDRKSLVNDVYLDSVDK